MGQETQNSKIIRATPEKIYEALTNPKAIEIWQVPGDMVGEVRNFDLRDGGGYNMSLFYPETETKMKGKTSEKEDKFRSMFIELIPSRKIIQAINFESADPDLSEQMSMEITIKPVNNGTNVTFFFKDIPKAIRPEENEAGTLSSLEKLAKYVE